MKDLSMQFFGELFVIEPTQKRNAARRVYWWCHCSCGNFVEVASNNLINGNTISCGCAKVKRMRKQAYKHGDSNNADSPYTSWEDMRQRCLNQNNSNYPRYGGRGIAITPDWTSYEGFKDWAIANGWQKGLTIDRVDNDGNYCPDNCEWVTRSENARRQGMK